MVVALSNVELEVIVCLRNVELEVMVTLRNVVFVEVEEVLRSLLFFYVIQVYV